MSTLAVPFYKLPGLLSQLDHPNIVQLYDYGFHQNGRYEHAYMSMEYVFGSTLAELIPSQQTKAWIEQCLEYIAQLLSALFYVHNCRYRDVNGDVRQGIFHGDIKPHNILFDRDANVVKLSDFMIPDMQTYLGRDHVSFENIFEITETFGTPEYMSPEQHDGEVTQQTDVFSLGVTLYQMVTGRVPNLEGALSYDRPSLINPYVPDWLEALILAAMEVDVGKRFQTVAQMVRMLEQSRSEKAQSTYVAFREVIMGDKVDVTMGNVSRR